ncbi:MAG: M56 family metallopeptidase, partial [Clostridiales bacterium]|nr:M56 family metallopeptidase [Clostridiales bacterium]
MAEVFLTLVNRGLSAGWLVLAVIAARFLLKKAPRWAVCALWGLVALRLLCPFSPESPLSLIPDAQPVSPEAVWNTVPAVEMAPDATEAPVSPVLEAVLPDGLPVSPTPAQRIVAAASILWCAGLAGMALYTLVSYRRLSRRVKGAVRIDGNLYQGAAIPTPFVLGVLRPRIYLPNTLSREDMPYVIAHERAHIRRRDLLWKALGFGLLSIYWFQPLLWLGYALFCRDMELACDEKVASSLSPSHRANYSQALLNCSAGRRFLAACPVAFGEVGVKERVKRVLSFRRPTLLAVLAAVLICAVIAVCFLTNPVTPEPPKVTVAQMSITAENVTPTGMTLIYHPDNAFQDVDAYTDSIYWLEKQNDSGWWQVVQPNQW